MSRLAVYSALLGGQELMVEQDIAASSAAEFHLFTDNPDLVSETWNVHVIRPRFALDPVRSARSIKILGRPELAEFSETLWIDNRIYLKTDPVDLVDAWLGAHDISFLRHSFRESVVDEFDAVAKLGYDEPARVYEQLIHYAQLEVNALDDRPFATGVMARRWTTQVRDAMEEWMAHVLRYSRRDQLSVGQALIDSRLVPFVVDVDNRESDFHVWRSRSDVGRTETTGRLRPGDSIRPPLIQLRELKEVLASTRNELDEARARESELLEQIASLEAQGENARAEGSDSAKRAEVQIEHLVAQVGALERLVLELTRAASRREQDLIRAERDLSARKYRKALSSRSGAPSGKQPS